MTSAQMERRIRSIEAHSFGNDYVASQDAEDAWEDAHATTPEIVAEPESVAASTPIVAQKSTTLDTRRFVGESDSEYAARVYGA